MISAYLNGVVSSSADCGSAMQTNGREVSSIPALNGTMFGDREVVINIA